jgi:hypothetical protein
MEHEMMSLVPSTMPAVTDACGCAPHISPAGGTAAPTDSSTVPTPPPAATPQAETPRRALKLVVTLTPAEGQQYRASVAVGSDDRDPILRSMMVSALSGALEQVPGLLEEAEAHWQRHPRNPKAAQAPARRPGADRPQPPATTPGPRTDELSAGSTPDGRADDAPPTPPATEPAVTPKPPTGGQLTLFG